MSAVDHFRLLSVKGQLSLESKGLKSSGGALHPRLAADFGLKPRDSYAKYLEVIQARIDANLAQRKTDGQNKKR